MSGTSRNFVDAYHKLAGRLRKLIRLCLETVYNYHRYEDTRHASDIVESPFERYVCIKGFSQAFNGVNW